MKRWGITGGVILAGDKVVPDGGIGIEGERIVRLASSSEIKREFEETIDAGGRLILPGIVNFHHHLYSSLAPGIGTKSPMRNFREILENLWWRLDRVLDEETIYYSALNGVLQGVKSGVTTIFDHHASMGYVKGSLSIIEEVLKKAGIKGVLCFETSDRGNVEEHIAENIEFFEKHRDDRYIKGVFGLHANFTLSEKTLDRISKERQEKMPIHIHCGEDRIDLEYALEKGYRGILHRLSTHGLLDEKSILAHCIHLSEEDYRILEDKKPIVVSNPHSNLNNRVGLINRDRIKDFVLGTDGFGSSVVLSLKALYLSGKGKDEDPSELYNIFFKKPSQVLNKFFPDTGEIKEGNLADIVVFDYIPPSIPETPESIIYHLIFGLIPESSYITISNGRIIYRDGEFTFLNGNDMINIRKAGEKLKYLLSGDVRLKI